MFAALTDYGMSRKAIKQELLQLEFANPRDYAPDVHKTVDDRPYGGGPGMVMKVAPLRAAIGELRMRAPQKPMVIALSPQGKRITQQDVCDIATHNAAIIFVAGRYEGIDERLYELEVDQEWSIGDYVLSGGELATMVAIDALMRMVPGVLGHEESAQQDSFMQGGLDHPHYTRPEVIDGLRVPEVLLSGNHAEIEKWRKQQRLDRTKQRRPDLLKEKVE